MYSTKLYEMQSCFALVNSHEHCGENLMKQASNHFVNMSQKLLESNKNRPVLSKLRLPSIIRRVEGIFASLQALQPAKHDCHSKPDERPTPRHATHLHSPRQPKQQADAHVMCGQFDFQKSRHRVKNLGDVSQIHEPNCRSVSPTLSHHLV